MKYIDVIKNSIMENFTGSISATQILLALLVSFCIGIFIVYIYRKTYTGVIYSKSFSLCLILLAMITSIIICTINSNLSLSLGMVGALSIVRFRTAIKEPVDTVFMFWSIAMGIMAGAGLYLIAVIASLIVGLLYFLSYTMGFKTNKQYLLVIKYDTKYDKEINNQVKKLKKSKLKSKSLSNGIIEATYEIVASENEDHLLHDFQSNCPIINVSLISYQNDFGA